ncbi:glycosyltransferase 25 domain containing 2 [Thecamonas trahens ATCC 50062]|uniref:Glycosyltransferase 25 domain containing 2 n=1 Tax=Thecamonas trahens ATCC 50062 TaxID=461836 RepID=A0A0L0DEJ6_THETB|nr:glycosyltransferase 25 domain containing 2 [Thecamonas trahens ATCC 50062]KNC49753.1 glycosyltransferase 25 domain containing 2 [Thecamonas trahens ATCC 50062]|eukprot:XP_013757539.1 glycosyltransferase 25 domain containing 2 [Thecamonas trahens ATCC 50062]
MWRGEEVSPAVAGPPRLGAALDDGPFKCSAAPSQLPSASALCHPVDPSKVLIDSVVVINLKRRSDRLSAVSAALSAAGLRALRFPAVDGKVLSSFEVAMYNAKAIRDLTPGLVGNLMSHSRVWARTASAGLASMLVLEDDATFSADLVEALPARMAELNALDPAWDIAYTGRLTVGETRMLLTDENVISHYDNRDDVRLSDHIISPGPSEGMWGYLISARGARKLLDLYAKSPILYDVDLLLHTPAIRNELAMYAFVPVLTSFDEADAYSDDSGTNTATNLLKRANKLIGAGLFAEAISRYERALEIGLSGAEHAWAHTNMAYIKDLHFADVAAAAAHFEAAATTPGVSPPAMADTLANYCFFHYRHNNYAEALTKCDAALQLDPSHEKAKANRASVVAALDG